MRPESGRTDLSVFRLAFTSSIASMRKGVDQVTAARIRATLVVVFLSARLFHLTQALIAIAVARATFTRPWLAEVLAAGCLIESIVLTWVLTRRRELSLGVLVGDAVFAAAGLAVMSAALSANLDQMTGSLNWMLPYSIATCAGLGLVAIGQSDPRSARRFAAATAFVAGLAATFVLASVLPVHGANPGDVVADALFYPVFFAAAASLAGLLQSRVRVISAETERVQAEAAEVARQAQWRVVLVDVFGPSLDLFERAARLSDDVPESLRHEAARLIDVIESLRGSHALD